MCVIILAEGHFPSEEMLRASEKVNKDGAGIAYIEEGKIKFSKGNLSVDDILAYKSFTKPPYLIHFRLASQGGNSYELAHPFSLDLETADEMEGTCSAVLAHNGTWARDKWEPFLFKSMQSVQKDKKLTIPRGPWSDSKAIAYIYTVHGDMFLEYLNEKVAILTPSGLKFFGTSGGEKGWNKVKDGKAKNGKELELTVSNILWKKQLDDKGNFCHQGFCG